MPFFQELTYRSDTSTDFHAWWLKRRGLAQGCAFLGIFHTALHLGGQKPQKTSNLGAWLGVFKPKSQNRKTCILSNYCIDSNQILHSDKDHQMPFVGGPDTRITNPRWRTAAILEKSKISHISAAVWPILIKFGTLMQFDLLDRSDGKKFEI